MPQPRSCTCRMVRRAHRVISGIVKNDRRRRATRLGTLQQHNQQRPTTTNNDRSAIIRTALSYLALRLGTCPMDHRSASVGWNPSRSQVAALVGTFCTPYRFHWKIQVLRLDRTRQWRFAMAGLVIRGRHTWRDTRLAGLAATLQHPPPRQWAWQVQ